MPDYEEPTDLTRGLLFVADMDIVKANDIESVLRKFDFEAVTCIPTTTGSTTQVFGTYTRRVGVTVNTLGMSRTAPSPEVLTALMIELRIHANVTPTMLDSAA